MSLPTPFVAYPTTNDLQNNVRALHEKLKANTRESQAATATRLIQGASHELIQTFFAELIADLLAAGKVPAYRDAEVMVREINEKLTHYLGWASGFFSNDRIRPAVEHYHAMMMQLPAEGSELRPFIGFAIPAELAQRADQVLQPLFNGQAQDAGEGIEVLIEVIDIALHALLITPKKLMKFNFVVDKTLNGVISLTQSLSYRSLRKLGEHLPPEHQIILARHMQRFLYTRSNAQAA